jgi:Leucine-rich repeat (LRR) protein
VSALSVITYACHGCDVMVMPGSTHRSLDLSNNKLAGSLPAAIGSLANLEYLDVSSNQLSGSIPATISNLVNLGSVR